MAATIATIARRPIHVSFESRLLEATGLHSRRDWSLLDLCLTTWGHRRIFGFEAGSAPGTGLRNDPRHGSAMNFEQAGDFGGCLAAG